MILKSDGYTETLERGKYVYYYCLRRDEKKIDFLFQFRFLRSLSLSLGAYQFLFWFFLLSSFFFLCKLRTQQTCCVLILVRWSVSSSNRVFFREEEE